MWEYKIDYVAIVPPLSEEDSWQQKILPKEERTRYGIYWWQKAIAEKLNEFGEQGWEVVSIPERLLEGEGVDGFILLKRLKRLKNKE